MAPTWRRRLVGLGAGVAVFVAALVASYLYAGVGFQGPRGDEVRLRALLGAYQAVGGFAGGILVGYLAFASVDAKLNRWVLAIILFFATQVAVNIAALFLGSLVLLVPAGMTAYLIGWPRSREGAG